MEKAIEILKRTGVILSYVIFILLIILSLLPLLGWYAGMIALTFAGIVYLLFYKLKLIDTIKNKSYLQTLFRYSLYAAFLGVIMQGSCSIYSSYRVGILYNDCQLQKKQAFSK